MTARSNVVVVMDADGSMDPAEIPLFVGALVAGADVVKGSRAIAGGGSEDLTFIRRWGNAALTRLANLCLRQHWTELGYGYAAFWCDCLDSIGIAALAAARPARRPGRFWTGPWYGHGFEIEALLFCRSARAGLRIAEVGSFEYSRRNGESHLLTWRDGCRSAIALLKELKWRRPQ